MPTAVQVRVLGPVEVDTGAGPVGLGGPALRGLLAALAVDAGRVVPMPVLAERLWDGEAGGAAPATLQSYVSRLRRLLEPERPAAGWQVLRTRPPGYQLDVDPEAVDAVRFERLLRRARALADPAAARAAVAEALGLWRGEAYADVPGGFAVEEARRLQARRLEARELAAELDLALGRHADLVQELPALVRAHPLREGLCRSLVLALYRSGRQAEALQLFAEVRERLAEALGADPGPELRRLHEAVLRQDPALDLPAPA
ncbi:AfsR/SARP family transcriptional regulator, partial [Kineococcus glutinatus]|uniref:AfsR/SARP family transcriptional regulator n=1 Tax=Kineococcus glutinatus TaxID=1070872 RepID=UPI0031F0AEEF